MNALKTLLLRLWDSPTFTTWGSIATRLLSSFIVLPMVLIKFSAPEVVVWQLFATMTTLLLLMDFGIAPTFTRLIAYANGGASVDDLVDMRKERQRSSAQVNEQTVHAVFATLRWLYVRVGLGLTALMCIGGTLSLIHPMGQLEDPLHAWLAWAVWATCSITSVWGNAFGAALQGLNRISVLRRWEIVTASCQIVTAFTVLFLGGDILALAVSSSFWTVFNAYRTRAVLFKEFPKLKAVPPEAHPTINKVLWPTVWRSGLGHLMSLGIMQSSGIIYSHLASAGEAAAYLLALRVMSILTGFSTTPYYSKLPKLGELYSRGERDEQLAMAKRGMFLSHWVFVAGAITVLFVVQFWLTSIGSKVSFVSDKIWILMSIAFLIERAGGMHMQLYSLTNHIVWHIANGVTGVVMIGAAMLMYPSMGLQSFPLAMILAYCLCYTPYAVYLASRHYKFSVPAFERHASALPVCAFAAVMITYWVVKSGLPIF